MKTELKEKINFYGVEYENVMCLKLPRKIKKDAKRLMVGSDGFCFLPRMILNKNGRKLISVCNKQKTYFKIGNLLFWYFNKL